MFALFAFLDASMKSGLLDKLGIASNESAEFPEVSANLLDGGICL